MTHITFIHGIANKPPKDELLEIWRRAIKESDGINLPTKGITSTMVYWADVMYAKPAEEADADESVGKDAIVERGDEAIEWRGELGGDERAFVDSLTAKLNFDAPSPEGDDYRPEPSERSGFERIPLPWFIKRRLMKALLRDVHHYLFNTDHSPRPGDSYRVQDEIRGRFVEAIKRDSAANKENGSGPHIVVSHSMGTVIAYDCLKRVPDCPPVDALMTIGSPLGIDEVQDKLKPEWSRSDGFPSVGVKGSWVNVADRLDPVSIDTNLAGDYKRSGKEIVIDQIQKNGGKWRHDITKYLDRDELRGHLAKLLGVTWP